MDLTSLAGQTGSAVISGIETQLNASLAAGTAGSFTVTPKWGAGDQYDGDIDNLLVIQNGEDYVLQTTIEAGIYGAPATDNLYEKNGFSFIIELPNGLVQEATLSYSYQYSETISSSASQDYIFLPGFTSGDPAVANAASAAGEGFTYKLNADKYGYVNTRFIDATDNAYFNLQLQKEGTGFRPSSNVWNLVELNLNTNDLGVANGSLEMLYNSDVVIAATQGELLDRTQIDASHDYQLSALMEVYRHYIHPSDTTDELKQQTIQFKGITLSWGNKSIVVPTETKQVVLDLETLQGNTGSSLISAIETQLNSSFADDATELFTVTPKWGTGEQYEGDIANLSVVLNGDDYALKTTIEAEVYGDPTVDTLNKMNGFSFIIEFPNGSVKEASLAYSYQYSETISTSNSQDYMFLPGLTSGDPAVANTTSAAGEGFTYKLNTDKYGYLNTRFIDATDNAYFNLQLQKEGVGFKPASGVWNLVELNLNANDLGTANGSLDMLYNSDVMIAKTQGELTDRTQIDASHEYQLSALMEVYRHFLNGDITELKQQDILIKDITLTWDY